MGTTKNLPDILSKKEIRRLAELEGVIAKNLYGAFQVGRALTEIRDNRLYRTDYATFEDYCRKVWDVPRQHAYRLIDATEVYDHLSTIVDISLSPIGDKEMLQFGNILPANEAQARPLAPLSPDKQVEAWTLVVETANDTDGKITANLVQQCVNTLKRAKIAKAIETAKDSETSQGTTQKATMSKEMRGAFQAFMDAFQREAIADMKVSVREDLANHLRSILEEIENG